MSRQVSLSPNRFPSGVNNSVAGANPAALLFNYPGEDPTRMQKYFNDFFTYAAGDWTITQTGGSAALADVASGDEAGVLALTASTGGTDSIYMQLPKLMFMPSLTERLWFEAKIAMDAVSTGTLVMGLIAQDTTPASNTDGIFFQKAAAANGSIDFKVAKSSTATTASGIATLVAGTYMRLGFYYDARAAELAYYVNGLKAGQVVTTNFPSGVGLTPTIGVAATSAVARTLSFDYLFAAKERWTANKTPDGR